MLFYLVQFEMNLYRYVCQEKHKAYTVHTTNTYLLLHVNTVMFALLLQYLLGKTIYNVDL